MKLPINLLIVVLACHCSGVQAQEIKPLSTIGRHASGVYCLAISPDGTTLVSGSWDKTARLWRLKNGGSPLSLESHKAQVFSVAFAPDGQTVATASWDKTIKFWNANDGKLLRSFDATTLVYAVAFAPDGKIFATGEANGILTLWNLDDGEKIDTLKGHTRDVTSVAFHPQGKLLVSGSSDGEIKLWDLMERREVATLRGHEGAIRGLVYSPDGDVLASAGESSVKIWDADTNAEVTTLDEAGTAVSFSPDSRLLALGSYQSTIRIVEGHTGKDVARLVGHSGSVHSFVFTPDGKFLISASGDKSIKMWKVPHRG